MDNTCLGGKPDTRGVLFSEDNTETFEKICLQAHKTACELNEKMCENCGEEYCQDIYCDKDDPAYIKIEKFCTEHRKLCPPHCVYCFKPCCKWICGVCEDSCLNYRTYNAEFKGDYRK